MELKFAKKDKWRKCILMLDFFCFHFWKKTIWVASPYLTEGWTFASVGEGGQGSECAFTSDFVQSRKHYTMFGRHSLIASCFSFSQGYFEHDVYFLSKEILNMFKKKSTGEHLRLWTNHDKPWRECNIQYLCKHSQTIVRQWDTDFKVRVSSLIRWARQMLRTL